ncbi:hypothetical protein BGZ49_003572 [Haplosporangium sp. Z 27]|nr:hypothetical protein BGZ49_003572 [Haplosporangium sp. Z 27]
MFTPLKNRNIHKKIEVENDEPTDEKNNNMPSVDMPSSSDVVKVKKVKKKIASTALSFGDKEEGIHLAKKKREQMRLRNDRDEEDFILLAGGDDNMFVEEKNTGLIREEEDDMDNGEADLENVLGEKLELGSKAERQAQRIKRNARKELIENMDEDEEDEEETREWEMQQIRNVGVDKKERKKERSAPVQKGVAFPTVT